MSKGLGKLQAQILATLERAKQAAPLYRGCGEGLPDSGCRGIPLRTAPAGWIWHKKGCMQVAEDVYDLRCSAAYLGEQTGLPSYQRSTFSAGFSRAVRGLVARQQLTPLWLVPLLRVDPDYPDGVEHLADGAYLMWHSRQIRFVKR